jgi:hypothetical protein
MCSPGGWWSPAGSVTASAVPLTLIGLVPNLDRSALVKAQVELIPADRDLKRIGCLDRKGFAVGADRHAFSDVRTRRLFN